MNRFGLLAYRILAAFLLIGLVMVFYLFWARPYQLQWGATEEETARPMPGDALEPHPTFRATRAITIAATPEEVWPWLLQMGYGRAGFYGYDIFENIGSQRGIASADHIVPEFQNFKVGDEVPLSPAGGLAFYAIEPNQYLIWSGPDGWGSFTWALYPIDAQHTRLVSRILWSPHWTQPGLLGFDLLTEFSDHLAVRKILMGVKGRVEGYNEPTAQANIEFICYVISALMFLISIVLVLARPLTWRRWLLGLTAGIVWLVSWYAPVSVWMTILLELWMVGMFWILRGDRSARASAK